MVGSNINRREMMKAVGTVSFGAGFLGQSKVATALKGRTVNSLSGKEKTKVLKKARNDPEFELILTSLREIGASPKFDDSLVKEITPAGEDAYNSVVVPFQIDNEQEKQINLLWMSRNITGTQLPRVLGHVADEGYVNSLQQATTGNSSDLDWELSIYTVNNGVVQVEQKTMQEDTTVSTSAVKGPGGGGGEEGCVVEIVECDSWDWTCIASIASALAGTVASCVACLPDPTKISCGLCLLGLFGGAAGTYDCAQNGKDPLRDECNRTTKWIAKSDLPSHFNYPSQCYGR